MNKLILSILSLCTLLLVGCDNGDSGLLDSPNTTDSISTFSVEPLQSSVPVGLSLQMTAIAIFDSGKAIDVTQDNTVNWSSSDSTIASISNESGSQGLVYALSSGIVTISASIESDNETLVASTTLTVTNAVVTQLVIEPVVNTLPVGLEQQYRATVVLSDNQTKDITQGSAISWQSSDASIATVSDSPNAKGLVTALQQGEVQIIASGSANGQTFEASATLTVTNAVVSQLLVKPETSSLPVGFEQQYQAEVILSDNQVLDVSQDSAISWQSSDTNVASISNISGSKGQVTAHSVGEVTITASGSVNGQTFNASATLNVTNAVVTQLLVEPITQSLPVGLEQQFTAKVQFSDDRVLDVTQDSAINWRVSDSNVATVSNATGEKGLVKTLLVGEVTVTASGTANGHDFEASATLNVTDAIITDLVVEPVISTLPVGLEQQYLAQVILSNNQVLDVTQDSAISWSSSDLTIASVSNSAGTSGLVTALQEGTVIVTASGSANGQTFSASANLTVTDAVVTQLLIEPSNSTLPVGLEQQYIAKVVLSDKQVVDITQDTAISWQTSDSTIASISNTAGSKGLVEALKVGEVTITASGTANGQRFEANTTLTVSDAIVTALQVNPLNANVPEGSLDGVAIPVGLSQSYQAVATLSDGSTLDVTNSMALSWSSDNPDVATITSQLSSGNGVAKGLSVGTVTISASGEANGHSFVTNVQLEVTEAVVTTLEIEPSGIAVPVGLSQQFTATATLSDDSTLDVTANTALTWSSDNSSVAIINPSTGLATGIATGVATITATGIANEQSFSASVELNVTNAIVTGFEITPADSSIPRGQTQQFIATAMLSDGSELNVTNNSALSWVSSAPEVAEISSGLSDNNGIAKGLTIGSTELTATAVVNGTLYSASTSLGITDKEVSALYIEGAASIPVYNYLGSLTEYYQVIAEYSDGETIEYPGEIEWTADITTSGLATFDSDTQAITTYPPTLEVSGDVYLTACTSQDVCASQRVVLFTRIIQVLESLVGGTDKTCEDIGFSSITITAFKEIFNSEYRPEDVDNWAYRTGTWSYGLVARVYGRIEPNTERFINKAAYIVTGANEFVTDTYDVLSTSYQPNHLICKID